MIWADARAPFFCFSGFFFAFSLPSSRHASHTRRRWLAARTNSASRGGGLPMIDRMYLYHPSGHVVCSFSPFFPSFTLASRVASQIPRKHITSLHRPDLLMTQMRRPGQATRRQSKPPLWFPRTWLAPVGDVCVLTCFAPSSASCPSPLSRRQSLLRSYLLFSFISVDVSSWPVMVDKTTTMARNSPREPRPIHRSVVDA